MPRLKESEWAKAKSLYETGDYSADRLAKKLGISDTAVENRIKRDSWIKGKNKEKIEKRIEETNLQILTRLGCTPEFRFKLLQEGLLADRTYVKGEYVEVEADHNARTKYHDIINKLIGDYAPEKKEISGGIQIVKVDPIDDDL